MNTFLLSGACSVKLFENYDGPNLLKFYGFTVKYPFRFVLTCHKNVQFSYIIIDNSGYAASIRAMVDHFEHFQCVANCNTPADGINKVLELKPDVIFLSVDSHATTTDAITFSLIGELSEYIDDMPTIIAISDTSELAYDAFQRGITGFLLRPLDINVLRKCLFRYQKKNHAAFSKNVCIKSQGDYHFVKAQEIVYLKADNNTTDFYLENGKTISAYKTLKYYENLLPSSFYRIHHSYVINIDFVSRINLGKSDCYLSNNKIVLPFSRTYKSNVDAIISRIS